MEILITGGSGFVGTNLIQRLEKNHTLTFPSRNELDLTDRNQVDKFFQNKSFDVLIHCAVQGGKSHLKDTADVLYNNIHMFTNLMRNKQSFSRMIHFTSGYELERSKNLNESFPGDYYGLSKNIISRICSQNDFITNIRIFGLFGENEYEGRFIKRSVLNSISGKPIEIFKNGYWDFIYIQDLVSCVAGVIDNPSLFPLHFDLVYEKKIKFSDAAEMIKKLTNSGVRTNIHEDGEFLPYLGDGVFINSIFPDFLGFEQGLRKMVAHFYK